MANDKSKNITVIGCGRWASFHAWYQAVRLGHNVMMWGRAEDPMYIELEKTRKNDFWELPDNVHCSSNLKEALEFSDYIIIVISAQAMRVFSPILAKELASITDKSKKTFILCMKGLDEVNQDRLSVILRRELDAYPNDIIESSICVWVGPGHIQEFLEGQPGVMIIDGEDRVVTEHVINKFKSSSMKLYAGDDLIGCEVGAAAKNVLGIAAGILDGAGLSSLKGALMARGVAEVSRLIMAMGGKRMTSYGLSHLGDFEATLFSRNSNNRRFGEALIKYVQEEKQLHKDIVKHLRMPLAEGVGNSRAIYMLSKKYGIEMPINKLIYEVLHQGKDPFVGFKEIFMRGNMDEFHY
ncbi:MAG: glycerol-3-phosphate dehydrogenase [Firmicutes bacterium]|nr:glycerol-3-phosphate dehydrogenase [Bacillota bacterium]